MTQSTEHRPEGPKTWHLSLADWGDIDKVWQRKLPFALWPVGEQALLFHWLDAAVDQGTQKVALYVADRHDDVRRQISEASLWPLQIEVHTVQSIQDATVHDCVNRLPNTPPKESYPDDAWSLILYWHKLEQEWLVIFAEETKKYGYFAAIGKNCEIADDVIFTPPYWIGNFVSIGPNCTVGPGAVIQDGCILAGGNNLERAHLGTHTYLGPEINLKDATIHRNELINFKHRARIKSLDAFLASGVSENKNKTRSKPTIYDRWIALRLYRNWTKQKPRTTETFTDAKGRVWPKPIDTSLQARAPWLKLVIQGKLALFGVTPRPTAALTELNHEWRSILRDATLGAFSYADLMGELEIGSFEESSHCVYQASIEPEQLRQIFDSWIKDIK
ncbi:MAG: hypothetical protein ACI81V_000033 [Lentimonas sp.]|jgi:hypothetical protein